MWSDVGCEYIREGTVNTLHEAIALRMIDGCSGKRNAEGAEGSLEFMGHKAAPTVRDEAPGNTVPKNEMLFHKRDGMSGRRVWNGQCFDPLGEVVDRNQNIPVAGTRLRKRAQMIQSNPLER
ncbi:hypothetical protein V5799_003746 [Amblyomma americanum]|uniref:Uncharacterized protein n=1 Tax=Amblyomma americanum TaxID=6943 RepID=A0AAQ4D831_AMBAM